MNSKPTPYHYVPSIRCLAPPDAWQNDRVTLDAEESHHLIRVLRLAEGATVRVLNGAGCWADGVIERADKKNTVIRCGPLHTAPEPRPRVILVQSLIKHHRMELVIQKMVELGCAELIPVLSDRSVVKEKADGAAHHRQRMETIALAALKQSCGYRLPIIHSPARLEEALKNVPQGACTCYGALEPGSRPLREVLRTGAAPPECVALLAGPEGDYSERERALLREAGAAPVSLGPTVLRSETAALYMLGAVRYEFDAEPFTEET